MSNPRQIVSSKICFVDLGLGTLDLTQIDGTMWPLSIAQVLFRHPLLQSVTLHFAYFEDGQGILSDVPAASTGLQELNLLSCNISANSLANLLRLPRHLKQLTVGVLRFLYSSSRMLQE